MNQYKTFYSELKNYLIKNNLQDENEFKNTSVDEINKILPALPLAYIEWLKIFGKTSCLLNYPIEDYTIEELEYAQEDDAKDYNFEEENRVLILISAFQDLHTYIIKEEENPTTFQINIGNPIFEEKLRNQLKFTTHIKNVIIHLINKDSTQLKEWFIEDLIDYQTTPYKYKQKYTDFLSQVEQLEENDNRIYSISEMIKIWNSRKN